MISSFSMMLISAIFIFIIVIYFYSKEHVNTIELKIYKELLIVNLFGLIFEMLSFISINKFPHNNIFTIVINKIYLIYFIYFAFIFFRYVLSVTSGDKYNIIHKKYGKISFIIIIMVGLFDFFLPLKLNYIGDAYSYGPAVEFIYNYAFIFIILCIILMIKDFKKLIDKKYIPLIVYIFGSGLVGIIQKSNPALTLSTTMDAIVLFIMYFTIENPDVRMIEQLNIARDHAEKANRAKTDFLSSMSHEIRTPLNAIVGFSEMIQTEDDMTEIKQEAKDIVMASHTLLEIVNGILDISKIEANKMEIVNKEYELLPELENISKLMIPRIGEKPLELRCKFAEDIPAVMYGDIAKIKEVITNILTNAVKYTEEGHIDFEVNCINQKEQSSIVIKVADTGRGIKKDQIDKLFTKFQRLDEDKNTTIEGTGLGLAITKSLVEMMGGKIIVNSEYGQGSTFTIYLKQKIVQLHKESDKKVYDDRDDYDFSGYTILVVDDNQLNLKVATKLLNRYNITVDTASDGFECIDKIKQGTKYDLVLLDDMMPRMKGTETLTRLKQDPNYSIPTIALTANAITGMREQYISMGFNDYLGKPIEKTELLRVLSKFLKPKVNNNVKEEKIEVKEEPVDKIDIEEEKTLSDKKILVVDDNQINIKIATKMLEKYNCFIESALSGKECLDKVKTTKYNIIFMDNMMPGMDGIETLKELKKIDGFNTPVIVLTADAITGSKEKFLNEGFDDYISKPIDRNYLDEVVTKLLNKDQ